MAGIRIDPRNPSFIYKKNRNPEPEFESLSFFFILYFSSEFWDFLKAFPKRDRMYRAESLLQKKKEPEPEL